ncbi:MAG: hypothetical protein IPP07_15220 [Holophagales bacterium]|nr:hypothetical protein [Holophagales bacterium]
MDRPVASTVAERTWWLVSTAISELTSSAVIPATRTGDSACAGVSSRGAYRFFWIITAAWAAYVAGQTKANA